MINDQWLCTKSNMATVQYRERSDRMAHSTLRLNSDGWFVECGHPVASLAVLY